MLKLYFQVVCAAIRITWQQIHFVTITDFFLNTFDDAGSTTMMTTENIPIFTCTFLLRLRHASIVMKIIAQNISMCLGMYYCSDPNCRIPFTNVLILL